MRGVNKTPLSFACIIEGVWVEKVLEKVLTFIDICAIM